MKTLITKYAAVCLLLYTGVLSLVVYWRTENLVMGIWTVLAAVGWMAWGFEHFGAPDYAEQQSDAVVAPVTAQTEEKTAPQNEQALIPINQMAEQVRVTLDEAEQAVALSIKMFKHIMLEAREMAQCAREMMNWGSEKSPLIHSALAHLSEKGEHISGNAQEVVTTFQFHDLLRQRLECIAAYLDTVPDSSADNQDAAARGGGAVPVEADMRGVSLPPAPVSYAAKQHPQADVTLF